ncbi:hypothetical protein OR263_25635 [Streptomyces sp. NEAU-H22]|uniref:hypothetical protein n=1 Tax=Streptomyces sp. NEAU-H22 TaxID=2994655 RepID=UPI0022574B48|nr:hypothetical protein [Streptomyces sp. NEAU-H22]MCX3290053.1 hypothetical protein [Streptomyces sp. NEAU-H22]
MPVYRAGLVDRNGSEQPRKPMFEKPENIRGDDWRAEQDRFWSTVWWAGVCFTHEEARAVVDGTVKSPGRGAFGRYPGAAKDVAHMPWLDGMLVLDFDRKAYDVGTGFVVDADGSARLAPQIIKFGRDDLYREAAVRGMKAEELDDYLDSWTEHTKSNGQHVVLYQHPELRLEKTLHHRNEYRVDVIAGPFTWRACAPTPGYGVLLDKPVKVAAYRLVELIMELNRDLPPVGGRLMEQARAHFDKVHRAAFTGNRGGIHSVADSSLMARWRAAVLHVVHLGNEYGSWNRRIYWAACRYGETGWAYDKTERDILAAAQPWDDRQRRGAIATLRNGFEAGAR